MEVLTHPNPALKQHALEVDVTNDADLRSLIRRMAEVMYENSGVGLAAPQIGIAKRIIVFDVDDQLSALCNPVIIERSDETAIDEEGCLSVPGISVPVERAGWIVCNGLTLDGKDVTLRADDFFARVLQHEIDHLDGVLILDRLGLEQRKEAIKAYNALMEPQRIG
ncbi:MAG: peptide deformylase [Coriobacteriia bacterium]|nr:peptide deformylase [Coriobacteriia bacterium]